MSTKKWAIPIAALIIASLILTACGPTPEPQVIIETVVVQTEVEKEVEEVVTEVVEIEKEVEKIVTEVVEKEVQVEVRVEVTPVPEPVDRKGGWLDMVVYLEEPSAEAAVTCLDVGVMDIYAYTVADGEVFQIVQGMDHIPYTFSFGSLSELTFNVAGPELESGLNPWANQKMREAMHWLIDRDYVVEEIYGGLARPRYTPLTTVFPDYAKVADVARKLESKYAHDPDKAKEVIKQEMGGMGAEMVDGKWTFNGEPVTSIFVIRTEDQRRGIGDYVANLLEEEGFTIDRQIQDRR
jgi:hypothetical protein